MFSLGLSKDKYNRVKEAKYDHQKKDKERGKQNACCVAELELQTVCSHGLFKNYFMFMSVVPACKSMYHRHAVPMKVRRKGHWIPSDQMVVNNHVGTGYQPGSFRRTVSALNLMTYPASSSWLLTQTHRNSHRYVCVHIQTYTYIRKLCMHKGLQTKTL